MERIVTMETAKKMNKAHFKGHKHSLKTKEMMSKAALGRKRSPESVEKTRQAHLGLKHSPEAKEKQSKANLGRTHTSEARENMSKAQKGRLAWNKGKITSLETREKISKACSGRKHAKESIEKMSKARLKYFETHEFHHKYKDTTPERLVEAHLKKIGVKYIKQKPIAGFLVDFYLPNLKTIVEVDGCFWHACSKCFPKPDGWLCKTIDDVVNVHMKDALKDNRWLDRGYKVIRIWGHEIKENDFLKLGGI